MKRILMEQTVLLMFTEQDQINKLISEHNWQPKKTKDGYQYLVRDGKYDEPIKKPKNNNNE